MHVPKQPIISLALPSHVWLMATVFGQGRSPGNPGLWVGILVLSRTDPALRFPEPQLPHLEEGANEDRNVKASDTIRAKLL